MEVIQEVGGVSCAQMDRSQVERELTGQLESFERALVTHLGLQKRKQVGPKLNGLLQASLDASGDPTWATDASGRCFLWNAAATRAWGFRREEVLGRTLGMPLTSLPPVSAEISVDGVMDGEFLHVSRPLLGRGNETLATLGMARRVAVQPELAREMRALKEAARTSEAMLAMASHELASPVSALKVLIVNTERAAAWGRDCPRWLRERIRMADQQVDLLADRLEVLLDVSRIRAGKFVLRPERFDLIQLAAEVVQRHQEQALGVGCRLTLHSPSSIEGEWDRVRMDQVLTNLIGNALKFGRGAPVDVEIVNSDGFVRIEVRDHGRGIPLIDQRRIFDPYERGNRERCAGLGLGLWITREIVSAHAGAISVSSVVGEGSCFTVVLPEA